MVTTKHGIVMFGGEDLRLVHVFICLNLTMRKSHVGVGIKDNKRLLTYRYSQYWYIFGYKFV